MMKYTICTPVESAAGNQFWTIEASSRAEALRKFKEGQGEFESEEIEVQSLGEPEIVEEEAG